VRGERSRYRQVQSSLCAPGDPIFVAVARALVAATCAHTPLSPERSLASPPS